MATEVTPFDPGTLTPDVEAILTTVIELADPMVRFLNERGVRYAFCVVSTGTGQVIWGAGDPETFGIGVENLFDWYLEHVSAEDITRLGAALHSLADHDLVSVSSWHVVAPVGHRSIDTAWLTTPSLRAVNLAFSFSQDVTEPAPAGEYISDRLATAHDMFTRAADESGSGVYAFADALLSHLDVAASLRQGTGELVWTSRNSRKILGSDPMDGMEGLEKAFGRESFRTIVDAAVRAFKEGSTTTVVSRVDADGESRLCEIRYIDATDDPAIGGLLAISQDVTAQHNATARAAAIRRSLDLTAIEVDLDGRVRWTNEHGSPISGNLFDHIEPSDRQLLEDALGRPWAHHSLRLHLKTPNRRILEGTVHTRTQGSLFVFADVTLREQARAKAAMSEARLSRVVDALDDAVFVVDNTWTIVEANAAAERMFGAGEGSLVGIDMAAYFTDHDQPLVLKVTESLRTGAPITDEAGLQVLSTGSYWRSVTTRPVPVPGSQMGMAIVTRDLTAERIADQERLGLAEELRHAFVALANTRSAERSTLAQALHDDPIQRLAGLRWRLAGQLDEFDRAELDAVYESLRSMTIDLRPPLLEEAGLEPALRELLSLSPLHSHLAADCTTHLPDAIVELSWRTIREAVRNAEQHAQANSVLVSVRCTEDSYVLLCQVADDGVGFSQADVDAAAERGHMGVVSMRETIQAAGGSFALRHSAEGGTEVVFSLPFEPSPPN